MITKLIGSVPELGGWAKGLGPESIVLSGEGGDLTKLASSIPMTADMEAFWRDYPRKNLKGYIFARINILGAGEYWGSNLNGDYFPEKALKEYHKTFHRAMVYVNHDHDDPQKAIGKVIFSTYNDADYAKRVELIVAIERDNPRAGKTVEAIESGRGIKVSMGCKVPFDRCSKCGNIAATRKEYCEHLLRSMNKVEPDGTLICAMNDHPAFFDASDVLIEADPSSGYMGKVAARIAEAMKTAKPQGEVEKESAIVKPDTDEKKDPEPDPMDKAVENSSPELEEAGKALSDSDPEMPEDLLEALSKFPLEKIFGTMAGMQMPLKPKEYTYIIIRKTTDSSPDARKAYRQGATIEEDKPTDEASFNLLGDYDDDLERILMPFFESRTMFPSIAGKRLSGTEESKPADGPTVKMSSAGAKYASYKKDVVNMNLDKMACLVRVKPSVKRKVTGEYGSYLVKTAAITDVDVNVLMASKMIKGAYGL